tara:strand:+ start:114 stop:629 length:516 start_codon:yes stop_codon:yes gene_type:complete
MKTSELWAPVAAHPLYEVSTHGRMRSWNAGAGRGPLGDGRREKPLLMKLYSNGNGRPLVSFWQASTQSQRSLFLHTLVLRTFKGEKPHEGMVCRHLDGDMHNNHLDNLKWGTSRENSADIRRHRGVSDDEQIAAVMMARRGVPIKILAECLGYTPSAVGNWVRAHEGVEWG